MSIIHIDTSTDSLIYFGVSFEVLHPVFYQEVFSFSKFIYFHYRNAPLRERKEDIPILLEEFLNYFSEALGRQKPIICKECYDVLLKYNWPGNLRELKNFAERLLTAYEQNIIESEMLYRIIDIEQKPNIEEMDSNKILKTLENNGYNKTKTAKELGISRTTLWKLLKENNIV